MGKVLSLLIGAIVAVLGLIFLIKWWFEFLFIIRGVLPVTLIFGGVIALAAGFSEYKDNIKFKKK